MYQATLTNFGDCRPFTHYNSAREFLTRAGFEGTIALDGVVIAKFSPIAGAVTATPEAPASLPVFNADGSRSPISTTNWDIPAVADRATREIDAAELVQRPFRSGFDMLMRGGRRHG